MEIREFADRILHSTLLDEKLRAPEAPLTDAEPGAAVRVATPARPPELRFTKRRRAVRMPHPDGFIEPRLRAVAHHIMANHELQALEVMAWTLRAFPDAPAEFRSGIIEVMRDEQRHTRLHLRRLESFGLRFGAKPVNGHVWRKALESVDLLDYLACLPLTFEGGNLDHSLEFADRFDRAGDEASANVMRVIHRDEIRHVAFGLTWLRRLKPEGQTDWDAYVERLHPPMHPKHAQGTRFDREARLAAGMTPEFIDRLERARSQQR